MDIVTSTSKLYDLLSGKIGKQATEFLLTFISQRVHSELEQDKKMLATNENLFEVRGVLKEEISAVRTELKEDIHAVRVELKEEASGLRVDMEKGFRQQFWLIVTLFLPLYFTLILLVFRLF